MEYEQKFDWSFARPRGSCGPWERVLDSDRPLDPYTLEPLGPDDCFKLEESGWSYLPIFKPKESEQ